LPTRKPDAKGRDQLVLAVEEKAGLTSRRAKHVVTEFWELMKRLIRRGEIVETPVGVFQARSGPEPQQRRHWGKRQTVYRRRPSPELRAACNAPITKESSMTDVNLQRNQLCCERCGSVYFVEAEFRQYREMSSSMPGGDLSPVTEASIRALICICGHPIPPGNLRGQSMSREDHASFHRSFEVARQYREVAQPQAIIGRLAESFAGREKYEKLAEQIAKLEAILRLRPPSPPASPEVPDEGTAS
jgi:hypothetical protein